MEKEILFASGDFYYEGTPVQSTMVKTEASIKEFDKVTDSLVNVFSIVQVLVVIFSIICLIKAIKTYIDNKKVVDVRVVKDEENNRIKKESAIKYFIMYIIMNIGFLCIEVVKNVLGKI